jgi:hypothetical protein
MLGIPVIKVVDSEKNNRKKWWAEEEKERHKGSLTPPPPKKSVFLSTFSGHIFSIRNLLNHHAARLSNMCCAHFSFLPQHSKNSKTFLPVKSPFTSIGPFLTSTLAPRGEICLLGEIFTPLFTPRGESSLLIRRMEGRTDNFTPRG